MRRTWVRVAIAALALSAFAVVLMRANPASVGTLIAINVGISVVAAPANVGVYEMSAAGALAVRGVPSAVGVSCGLAMHAAEVALVLLLGLIVLVTTGVRLTGTIESGAPTP